MARKKATSRVMKATKVTKRNMPDSTLRLHRALRQDTEALAADVKRLRATLGTLIVWMAQSAGSPLSQGEAAKLLDELRPGAPDGAR